jgi:hypothetical protein
MNVTLLAELPYIISFSQSFHLAELPSAKSAQENSFLYIYRPPFCHQEVSNVIVSL